MGDSRPGGPAPDASRVVVLRPTTAADFPTLHSHQLDPDARHMAAFASREPLTREQFDAKWSRLLADPSIVARTILVDGEIVGSISRFPVDGSPNLTYWIAREWWGKGVATRALAGFLAELPERPIHASAAGDNAGSLRVLERCGFRRVGTETAYAPARDARIEEVFLVTP